jgi:hypothetical protein
MGFESVFWELWFGGRVQRRGTHVNPLKIGSRGDKKCFGGISAFHAELRRELVWGNLDLVVFWLLGGSPRGGREEGDHLCFPRCFGGMCQLGLYSIFKRGGGRERR